MSVYIARDKAGQPKSPYWQYDFQCRGARFCGSFDGQDGRPEIPIERPRKEAERAEAVLRASTKTERPKRERMTLHEAGAYYWTHKAQHEANSASVWGFIANLVRIIGKFKYIDEIGDAEVAAYVAKRRTEHARRRNNTVSNSTVNRDTETLREIMTCVRPIAQLPAEIPSWGRHRLQEKKRIRSLTHDEDSALFAAVDALRPDFRDMLEFALEGGKRLSEIIFLEKSKIDRRARTARVIAKGSREIVMALTAHQMEIVERNWMNHPTRLFTYVCQRNGSGRRKGMRYPFTIDGWREQWKAILERAGVPDFRFHDFRHTAATRVLAATGNLKAVQDTLDHEDIRSSTRYAHTYVDQRREALEAAGRLRPSKPRLKSAGV